MRSLIPLSLLLTIFDNPVHAYIFPFHVRVGNEVNPSSRRRSPYALGNIGNAQYVTNMTVAGKTLPILMDTGSSDLWVHFADSAPTSQMKDTGKSITLAYAVGKASGHIQTTQVQMGDVTVSEQAMLWVNDTSTFTADIHSQGYDGLLGLGPNQGSVIYKTLKKTTTGNTFLQNVFESNRSTDNYITILLDRKNDPGEDFTGQFTISELIPKFEGITNMPKLDVETVNRILKADQHWQALTDKNQGIIGPDGQPIQMKSIVPKAPSGQYVAVIDSGFTFSQIPRDMSDAIYGRVRGAFYDTTHEYWLVPCGQYLNVSFNFGGVNYPIHPLDLVDDNFAQIDSTGKKVCIGSFQPITSAFSILGHYDMILGMSFLRSTYALLDFGKWIGNSGDQDTPYMQLMSTVDPVAARKDFITVRLGGNDTISDPRWSILPANETVHSPVSAEEKKKKYQEMILSRWPYIFVGCLAFVIITVGLCIWKCCCRNRGKKGAAGMAGTTSKKGFKDFFSKKTARESYVPLEAQRSTADLSAPAPYGYSKQQQAHPPSPTYPSYPAYPNGQEGYHNNQQGYHQGHHQV